MKKIIFVIVFCAIAGCTERERQKNVFTGGDPALATETELQEVKKLLIDLKSEMNSRFDKLENKK